MPPREKSTHNVVRFDGRKRNDPDWRGKLRMTEKLRVLPNDWNAEYALDCSPEWHGVLQFNEFTNELIVAKKPPYDQNMKFAPRLWDDHDAMRTAVWLQGHDIEVRADTAHGAAVMVARKNGFHPVREYLGGVKWDGVPRLDGWLTEYLGVAADEAGYVSAVGTRWMVAAVARIMEPGTKIDSILILEGSQGIGKSTALRALCHDPKWFSDQLDDLGSKDSLLQLAGVWILELSELDALVRKESTTVKSFLSRTEDRYRPPYGRTTARFPRQLVLAGTTNATGYLKDETGARRFWPVKATRCDIDRIAAVRDQLWAEAVARYDDGTVPLYLDTLELRQAAEAEQAARYQSDPWADRVGAFIAVRDATSVPEILGDCLGIEAGRQGQAEQNRVARILTAAGWERRRSRRSDGPRGWEYRRAIL